MDKFIEKQKQKELEKQKKKEALTQKKKSFDSYDDDYGTYDDDYYYPRGRTNGKVTLYTYFLLILFDRFDTKSCSCKFFKFFCIVLIGSLRL